MKLLPETRIFSLGRWAVLQAGVDLESLPPGKMAILLAYLTLERDRVHARDQLAPMFWPDQPLKSARNNLRQSLHQLRRALEPKGAEVPLFEATRQTVTIHPEFPVWIDAAEVRGLPEDCAALDSSPRNCRHCLPELERRAELYRGPFLQGMEPREEQEDLADWLHAQREHAHQQALTLLDRAAACRQALGAPELGLGHARRALDLDPCGEMAHRRVMELLADMGRIQDALQQYGSCERLLARELGVDPEPATRALARDLRDRAEQVPERGPERPSGPEPGRQQVTVLALRARKPAGTDPEEQAEALELALRKASEMFEGYGGTVSRGPGGVCLAYFGIPRPLEGAGYSGVCAALAALRELAGRPGLEVRAGVHSGIVVGTGEEPEVPDPAGTATEPAMDAAERADPGTLVITEPVRLLTQGFFQVEPLSTGADGYCHYAVQGRLGVSSRLDAVGTDGLAPFVGREAEMEALLERWSEAEAGQGSAVLIRGEAGVGKSRLVRAFAERLENRAFLIREYRSLPHRQDTPYSSLLQGLPALFGFRTEDSPERKIERMEGVLENVPDLSPRAPFLIGRLLALPVGERYPDPGLSPLEEKEETLEALATLGTRRARGRPHLLVVEDLHWADPSTEELLRRIVDRIASLPMVVVVTARSETPIPPDLERKAGRIDLPVLPEEAMRSLLDHLDREGILGPDMRQRILDRSDGIPLYAEELGRAATEAAGASGEIPGTLGELLAARLDRLEAGRELVPLAAVLGREFPERLLAGVAEQQGTATEVGIERLVETGILRRVGGEGDPWLQFRHVLIQEAAYQRLLKRQRRDHHARVAAVMRESHPDLVQSQPGLLARHLTEAGEPREALTYWHAAAERAWQQGANAEAEELCNRGLDLTADLEISGDLPDRIRALYLVLGRTRLSRVGYSPPEVGEAFRAALKLSPQGVTDPGRFEALWGLWLGAAGREGHLAALEMAHGLQRLAAGPAGPFAQDAADYAVACSAYWAGDFTQAERFARRGSGWAEGEASPEADAEETGRVRVDRFGMDTRALSASYLAVTWWQQGWPESALKADGWARRMAESHGHVFTRVVVLSYSLGLAHFRKEPDRIRGLVAELEALSGAGVGYRHLAWARLLGAWADAAEGDARAIPLLEQEAAKMSQGLQGLGAFTLSRVAEALEFLGYRDKALEVIARGLELAEELGDRITPAELLITRGRALAKADPAGAEETLFEALEKASAIGSIGLSIQAAVPLGHLLMRRGRSREARATLESARAALGEGRTYPEPGCLEGLLAALPAS